MTKELLENEFVDFFDTTLMTAALEFGIEENVDHLKSQFGGDETRGHGDNIGVVVLTAKLGYFLVPAKGATNIRIFVDSHLNAIARAAYNYAALVGAIIDSRTHFVGEVGIIDTV